MRKKYLTDEERKQARREASRRYYSTNKGAAQKKTYDKAYRASAKGSRTAYQQTRRHTREGYIDRFLERARVRTPDTDLDREYLEGIFGETCHISGQGFEYVNTEACYHNALAPSIDRIDSRYGYYRGNVQIILSCINRMKNDMPNDSFLKLWKALTE